MSTIHERNLSAPSTPAPLPILLIAGEASADLHGAEVLKALLAAAQQAELPLECLGIGGPLLRALPFTTLARAEEISLTGLTEVLTALPRLTKLLKDLVRETERRGVRLVLLIDLPDFNLRLAKKLRKCFPQGTSPANLKIIYYISPQVWAWRAKRVELIKKLIDKMLVIFNFEVPFYEQAGVPVQFVGHPLLDELPPPTELLERETLLQQTLNLKTPPRGLRKLKPSTPLLAFLPGSRPQEVRRHLPVMLQALEHLDMTPEVLIIPAPTISPSLLKTIIEDFCSKLPVQTAHAFRQHLKITAPDTVNESIAAADMALVCSGTATLQTALLGTPLIVCYRVSWLSYQIFKRLIKVRYLGLVNLVADEELAKELIQQDFTPIKIANELSALWQDQTRYQKLAVALKSLKERLPAPNATSTAAQVATVISEYLKNLTQDRAI